MKKTLRNIVAIPFLITGILLGSVAFVCVFLAVWFTETGIEIMED